MRFGCKLRTLNYLSWLWIGLSFPSSDSMPSPNAKAKSTTTCKRERSSSHVSHRLNKKVSCSLVFDSTEMEAPIVREVENSVTSSQMSQNGFNGSNVSSKERGNEENQISSSMDTSVGQTCLSSNGCVERGNEEKQMSSDMDTSAGQTCLSSNGRMERDNDENQMSFDMDTSAGQTCLSSNGCMERDNDENQIDTSVGQTFLPYNGYMARDYEENQISSHINTSVEQTCLSSDGCTGLMQQMDSMPYSLSSSSEAVLSSFHRLDDAHRDQFEAVSGEQITWATQVDNNNFANFQIPDIAFDNYVYDASLAAFFGDEITEFGANWNYNALPYLEHAGTNLLYDVPDGTMLLPTLENTTEAADYHYGGFGEENSYGGFGEENSYGGFGEVNYFGGFGEENQQMSDSLYFHLMTQAQAVPFTEEVDVYSMQFDSEYFDTERFVSALFDESNSLPALVSEETIKKKQVTLVLDLDETLVHASRSKCENADFTIQIRMQNIKEYPMYVRQRPFLREFLEKVSEMFEVIIFTASKSLYADQLLDILDPDKKFFSRRFYRESCILLDGTFTKDLTVLGIDLAKVAIVDNSPEVFRLQVDNGIPIESWYNDPTDSALISLLPFLEKLADVDDVRPIIAEKFGTRKH